MKRYQITSSLSIEGDTLKDAIESGIDRIARELHLGNGAGYYLHQVWCEYDTVKQSAALHIISSGSDSAVSYDPAEDTPVEKTLLIPAFPEDCPSRIDFEFKAHENPAFDPFDDSCLPTPSHVFGAMLGIIDEIGKKHCMIREDRTVTEVLMLRCPNLSTVYPLRFAEFCRRELTRRRPKTDKETTRLMARVSELVEKLLETPNNRCESEFVFRYKTNYYFRTVGKITALAVLRAQKGMTQKQLADTAQMSVRQLQNYEKCPGSTLWSASRSVPDRLAAALGVKRSDIVDSHGSPILVSKN